MWLLLSFFFLPPNQVLNATVLALFVCLFLSFLDSTNLVYSSIPCH